MKNLGRNSLLVLTFFLITMTSCNTENQHLKTKPEDNTTIQSVRELAKRVLKDKDGRFIFQLEEGKAQKDFFEISGKDEKILIKGNNGLSMASGLNW